MNFGKNFQGMGRYMLLSVQMVATTLIVTAVGYWLDRITGKSPLFLLVFFGLGSAAGFLVVYRAVRDDGGKPG